MFFLLVDFEKEDILYYMHKDYAKTFDLITKKSFLIRIWIVTIWLHKNLIQFDLIALIL